MLSRLGLGLEDAMLGVRMAHQLGACNDKKEEQQTHREKRHNCLCG